jgi:hypothetical protein
MKTKLASLLVLTALFLASCTPNNPQPNPSPNTTITSWKFTITINGVTHRAESSSFNVNSNYCVASISNSWSIHPRIIDKTAASYISGDNGELIITIDNPSLGVNSISNCMVLGSWITDAINYSNNGYSLTLNGPMVPNSSGGLGPKIPINLTSLGSAGNGGYNNSQPVKGNYSGTLYFKSSLVPDPGFDTPVTIDINFEAVRP